MGNNSIMNSRIKWLFVKRSVWKAAIVFLCFATFVYIGQTLNADVARTVDYATDILEYLTTPNTCIVYRNVILKKSSVSREQNCVLPTYCKLPKVISYSSVGDRGDVSGSCSVMPAGPKTFSIQVSRYYRDVTWHFAPGVDGSWTSECGDGNTFDVGLFPRHLRYLTNIYFFQMHMLGPLVAALNSSIDLKKCHKVALVLPVSETVSSYRPFLDALNIGHIVHLDTDKNEHNCFRQAVLPSHALGIGLSQDVVAFINRNLNISDEICAPQQVTIIQRRGSRNLVNADKIAKFLAHKFSKLSYPNIVYLEDLSIREQIQTMHCSTVLIGVQGAALSWLQFLPKNAHFVEIWFEGWRSRYVQRALNARTDLHVTGLKCEPVTSLKVWLDTAKHYGITGNFSEDLKQRVVQAGLQPKYNKYDDTVWKRSSCKCDLEKIESIFKSNPQLY